jgi:sirohydrochlorin ferrochelatase
MKAILLMAHGSPRAEANDDVRRVAELVRARVPLVIVGYLDCNQPDVPTALDACVTAGASEIAAVPYFLHSGRHFLLDLPALMEDGARRHPGVTINMGDYIGHLPEIAGVVRDRTA